MSTDQLEAVCWELSLPTATKWQAFGRHVSQCADSRLRLVSFWRLLRDLRVPVAFVGCAKDHHVRPLDLVCSGVGILGSVITCRMECPGVRLVRAAVSDGT
ncbi:hypothetical protein [Streptomyces sp. NPDC091209]|uniref:hypothetical protein n=1 Tax=Streptomyces sp. NPDC091209 TaxID=3365974 RepID=UPI00381A93F7